jgi:hypothetical protein
MNTEMNFNDEPKHGQVFCASGYCGSFEEYYTEEEISDEEILKAAKEYAYKSLDISIKSFELGARWYREQLKERQ